MSWLQDHPAVLERMYLATQRLFAWADPMISRIGYQRVDRFFRTPEDWVKALVFDCMMCGQCILHSTGMTCPMTCPKNLRNGPCGGVRANGHCEVKPEMRCVWVQAFERSQKMTVYSDELLWLQPPVNRQLEGTSAWINMLTGEDKQVPTAWQDLPIIPLLEKPS